jgi:hypothetical protein
MNYGYQLKTTSPGIDKGNNAWVSGVSTDVYGKPRIYGGVVDLGAYECIYFKAFLPMVIR